MNCVKVKKLLVYSVSKKQEQFNLEGIEKKNFPGIFFTIFRLIGTRRRKLICSGMPLAEEDVNSLYVLLFGTKFLELSRPGYNVDHFLSDCDFSAVFYHLCDL